MSNVDTSLLDRLRRQIDNGGEPPDDGRMEDRVKKLEEDLSAMKTDVAVMRATQATKEDLHRELHATTWKIIGCFALLCTAVFWIARNVAPASNAPALSAPAAGGAPQGSHAGAVSASPLTAAEPHQK
jgi:hypothetical protein